eukprot:gb/GECG01009232.1/.p1 GENE.gb/GECG01009232.1/~~gb/GECG01009232.1/.p1  ORF type:complete len:169 (+),score=24.78 gb/GECG01009232.1/:1-507(+)
MEGWTRGELVNKLALGLIAGTVILVWLAITQKRDFFLLVGTLGCVFGNLMFVAVLRQDALNQYWIVLFILLALVSLYGLIAQFSKFRRDGFVTDSEEEEGDEDEDGISQKTVAEQAQKIMEAQRRVEAEGGHVEDVSQVQQQTIQDKSSSGSSNTAKKASKRRNRTRT